MAKFSKSLTMENGNGLSEFSYSRQTANRAIDSESHADIEMSAAVALTHLNKFMYGYPSETDPKNPGHQSKVDGITIGNNDSSNNKHALTRPLKILPEQGGCSINPEYTFLPIHKFSGNANIEKNFSPKKSKKLVRSTCAIDEEEAISYIKGVKSIIPKKSNSLQSNHSDVDDAVVPNSTSYLKRNSSSEGCDSAEEGEILLCNQKSRKDKNEMLHLDDGELQLSDGDIVPKKAKKNHIKRPLNAFMVWSKINRRKMMEDDPTLHHSLISKRLGEGWKSLPASEKQRYFDEAKRLGELHSQVYPDYKYKPRRKSAPVRSESSQQPPSDNVTAYSEIVSTTDGCIDLTLKGPNQHISTSGSVIHSRSNIQSSFSIIPAEEKKKPLPKNRRAWSAHDESDTGE